MAGAQKRGKTWYARLTLPDGRERKKSLGPDVKTRSQASRIAQKMQAQIDQYNVSRIDPSRATLGQMRQTFLDDKRAENLAATTIKRYDLSLRTLADTYGDGCLIRNLTAHKLRQWAGLRLKNGVTPQGVNADLRGIKAALNWAADPDIGLLLVAPRIKMVKAPRRLPRDLTPEEISALFSAEENIERLRLWKFIAWTGCRRAEALGLHWEHIRWEPRPLARVVGKGDKERWVCIFPPALDLLGRARQGPVFNFSTRQRGHSGLVLQPVQPDTITHWWQDLARQAEVKAALKDLRAAYGTLLANAGISMRFVQQLLGHESVVTTERHYVGGMVVNLYDDLWRNIAGTIPSNPKQLRIVK